MNVVKISFLLQYRRIFQSSLVQKVCLYAMVYVVLWACTQVTILGISCLPISFLVPSTADWCLNTLPVWYFSSAMSLATDFLIFGIPLPSVIKLVLHLRQKIIVILIFCLGFLLVSTSSNFIRRVLVNDLSSWSTASVSSQSTACVHSEQQLRAKIPRGTMSRPLSGPSSS